MREATEKDLDFLADCYVKIACHMKAGEQDLYIARLPETPDETIRNHVRRYVGREDALTLWRKPKHAHRLLVGQYRRSVVLGVACR
jgi:hypothetical protein